MPINSPEADLYPSTQFSEGDLSLYRDFTHPKGWGRKQIRHFLDREFKQHPDIKQILYAINMPTVKYFDQYGTKTYIYRPISELDNDV